jgi:glycosyltransferase involved in cell wall biosynthesis
MKVLQAMALGKAVVTTTRGAAGVMAAGDAPALLVGDDADALADAIARLLDDRALRLALGRRARAVVEAHHSPAAYGRRLETGYAALVGPAAVEGVPC